MKKLVCAISFLVGTVTVEGALAQTNLTECGTISSPGSYLLQNDVSSPDTCFKIEASDVTLDLNGHTVRFADRATEVVIPNFDFEQGSGTDATSWDQSGASSAQRTDSFPAIRDRWVRDAVGSYAMKFDAPSGSQYIYSQEIGPDVIEPDTIHVLSAVIHRYYGDHSRVTAFMVDKDGNAFCTNHFGGTGTSWHYAQTSDRNNFWAAYDCGFVASASDYPLRVKVGVSGALDSGHSAYFDAIEVKPGNDYKYESYDGGTSEMVGIRAGDVGGRRDNIRITNGRIEQGAGKVYYPRGIYLRGDHLEVDNIVMEVYGPDASGIFTSYANAFDIHHNEVTLDGKRTHYSHQGWVGAIEMTASGGDAAMPNAIHHNVVHRSPAAGIRNSREYTEIHNNTVNLEVSAIHCYGIFPRAGNQTIYDNVIQNNYGSGIFLESVTDSEVYGNYIEVTDVPHEDYEWTGKALWTRYQVGNLNIHDNTFIGYAGNDHPMQHMDHAISVVRLGGSRNTLGPITFTNNVVEGYTNDLDSSYYGTTPPTYAVALDFNVDSGDTNPIKYVENNTFRSNHIVALFGGDYARGYNAKLSNNIFEKVDSVEYPAVDSFTTIFVGRNDNEGNEVLDTAVAGGADMQEISIAGASGRDLELDIKWTLVVLVEGSNGQCVQGASVSITNPSGSISNIDLSTDAGGMASAVLLGEHITGSGSSHDRETLGAYSVTASSGGQSDSTSVTMDTRKEVTLSLAVAGSVACNAGAPWSPGAEGGGDPRRSNGAPSGVLAAGTTQTDISLTTDEDATCRYSTTAGTAYEDMTGTFDTTGGTQHSTTVDGLEDDQSYTFYVRCEDDEGNSNGDDYNIGFSVSTGAGDTEPPGRSGGEPTGILGLGTTETEISVTTSEEATCRYATTSGVDYADMTGTFDSSDGTTHTATVTGLEDDQSYRYFIRCEDAVGNINDDDYEVTFSVGSDRIPPVRTNPTPTGELDVGTTTATIGMETNEAAECRYATVAGVAFESMTDLFMSAEVGRVHSAEVTVEDGAGYAFMVRCRDAFSNVNTDDFLIEFTVGGTTEPHVQEGCPCSAGDSGGASAVGLLLMVILGSWRRDRGHSI